MTYSIKHLFHIAAPREQVFSAITSIEGLSNWWTAATSGDAGLNGIVQFRFGDMGPDMKVRDMYQDQSLTWECVASPHGWVGNTITFSLDENDGKTRVRFSHDGWTGQDDFYAACCFSWARFMESLRQYCQTGKGEAFGAEGYRK